MKKIPLILMGCGGVGRHLLQHIVSCRSLHSTQRLFLSVLGVGDSKSLVVAEDLMNKGFADSFLLELCRVKHGGESLSKLRDFGECRLFMHPESQGKMLEIASQLGKEIGVLNFYHAMHYLLTVDKDEQSCEQREGRQYLIIERV